jgi:CubicO group peptidase (beta-lactamase class C family)
VARPGTEIGDSAFANATVREVMDMTTGVQYSEDYSDPDADIWLYSAAASPLPKPEGYAGPDGYWEYLQQVRPEGNHGDQFRYKTMGDRARVGAALAPDGRRAGCVSDG